MFWQLSENVATGFYWGGGLMILLGTFITLWGDRERERYSSEREMQAELRVSENEKQTKQAIADAAAAKQRTAEVEKENILIRKNVSGRRITQEEHDELVKMLSSTPATFDIEVMSDGESGVYAADIIKTLEHLTKPLEMIVANERTAEGQEGLVDVGTPFVAHAQTAKAVEPGERAFNDPAVAAQVLAAVLPTAGNAGHDAACPQGSPATSVVVAFVGVELFWSMPWPSPWSGDGRHGVDGLFKHLGVVHVGGREHGGQGQAAALYHKVALRARAAAIDRIRAGFFAPFCAGIEQESSAARLQSRRSASASRWSSTQCKTSHTPCACQSRSRRQHVMPEPHPISGGSSSHGVPVRSTKTMPVSTARSGMRGLPPRGRGGAGGRIGSTSSQSLSLTNDLAIDGRTYQKIRFC